MRKRTRCIRLIALSAFFLPLAAHADCLVDDSVDKDASNGIGDAIAARSANTRSEDPGLPGEDRLKGGFGTHYQNQAAARKKRRSATNPLEAFGIDVALITGAYTNIHGTTYLFFDGGLYGRIDDTTFSDGSVGLDHAEAMPRLFENMPASWYADGNVDAVMPYKATGNSYVFKNAGTGEGCYARMSAAKFHQDYPKAMPGGWQGLSWKQVDAAMYLPGRDKHYIFKGPQYVRLTGVQVNSGYPKPIAANFLEIPPEFAKGIDAATVRDGKIYMFKGDQYIRLSLGRQLSDGRYTKPVMDGDYPQPIKGVWHK